MCSPSTVTRPQSVLTDGLTLSRSICEMRLGETPTRRAISRTVRPWRCRSSRSRAPIRDGAERLRERLEGDASIAET